MEIKALNNQLQKWYISYNPYTDIFQIYSKESLGTSKSMFKKTKINKGELYLDKTSDTPLFIQFKDAYRSIGDIDNMSKEAIIQKVMEYVK